MDTTSQSWHTPSYRVRVAAGGRIVIPAEVRQDLGLKEGDELLLYPDGRGVRITTLEQTVREVQAFFAGLAASGAGVVDELLRERREEAAKEERELREYEARNKS